MPIALTDASGFAFPKSVPICCFPKWPVGDGEKGKIALNDWPLSGARIVSLNVRVWAKAVAVLQAANRL